MNEIQSKLLEIWLDFDKACKELNIKYVAIGGTALGALRHKGFIPWDDDMDFGMLREDYERFLREAPSVLPKKYFVQDHSTDPNYLYPFLKVRDCETTAIEWDTQNVKINHGLWIDIFPFDYLPSNDDEIRKNDKRFWDILDRFALSYHVPGKTKLRSLLKPFRHFLFFLKYPSKEKAYRQMMGILTGYDSSSGYGSFCWSSHDKTKTRFKIDILDEVRYEDFEGEKMPVMKRVEEYLVTCFGDWKKLPPENQRITHPLYKFDLSKSYKEYIK